MLKHSHKDFPSDVFIVFEALGAKFGVISANSGAEDKMSPSDWLNSDMKGKVLAKIYLPELDEGYHFK